MRPRDSSIFPPLAIIAMLFAYVPSAQAQDTATTPTDGAPAPDREGEEDTARSHFRVGQLMYGEGRFEEAAAEFDRAYALSGRSALLYNAYLAHRDAGRLREATERLRGYLQATVDAPNREALEQRLSAMEETLAEQERIAAMSEEERAELEAERRRVAEEAEQHRLEAERQRQALERSRARRSPGPYIVLGTGGALVIAGAITGVIAGTRVRDIEDNCPDDRCPSGFDLQSERDAARRMSITTDVLLATGGATAVVGLIQLIIQRNRHADPGEEVEPDETTATVTGGCTTTGCEAGVQVNF